MSFNGYGDFESGLFGPDPLEYADSYGLLHDYQRRSIIGKKEDYNYEYDRFPKNFIYSKQFQGAQSNPYASKLDQFHTETFLTNKVRNIEKVYLGSDEYPELMERAVLPQSQSLIKSCGCSLCRQKSLNAYEHDSAITKAIEELEKKNDILTLILVFIVIYCVVQLLYPTNKYATYSHATTYIAPPSQQTPAISVPPSLPPAPPSPPAAPTQPPSAPPPAAPV